MVGNPRNLTALPLYNTEYCRTGALPSAAGEQGGVWCVHHPRSALPTVQKRLFNTNQIASVSHPPYLLKEKCIKFLKDVLLKEVVLVQVRDRDCSFEPPPDTEAPPECLEVPPKKKSYSRNTSMTHRANVNIVHYPIREIKHVHLSFNCSVFCSLNSAWLRAVRRKMELQSASKSSNSQRDGGAHLK